MTFVFVILGLLPYVFGYFIHQWTEAGSYGLSEITTAVIFLIFWMILGALGGLWSRRPLKVMANLNFFGFANLVFVAFQLLIFKDFMDNIVGDFSWYFFQPAFGLGAELSTFVPVEQTYFIQAAGSYVLMLLFALVGAIIGSIVRIRMNKKNQALKDEAAAELAKEMAGDADDAAEEVADVVEDRAEEVKEAAEDIKDAAENKAEEIADAVENKAEEVKEAAEDIKDTVEGKAEEIADAVEGKAEEVAAEEVKEGKAE